MDFKKLLENKWLLVLGVIGVLCLLTGTFWNGSAKAILASPTLGSSGNPTPGGNSQNPPVQPASTDPTSTYATELDTHLTNILQQIAGINSVSVMVMLDSTAKQNYLYDTKNTTQTTTNSGRDVSTSQTEEKDAYTGTGSDGGHSPVVVSSDTPTVRGVLVVVNANDFVLAKSEIIDAIKNVLDVPAYKISVEPQKVNS